MHEGLQMDRTSSKYGTPMKGKTKDNRSNEEHKGDSGQGQVIKKNQIRKEKWRGRKTSTSVPASLLKELSSLMNSAFVTTTHQYNEHSIRLHHCTLTTNLR